VISLTKKFEGILLIEGLKLGSGGWFWTLWCYIAETGESKLRSTM